MTQRTKLVYGLSQPLVDQLNAAGYVIVPKNPTDEMVDAVYDPSDIGADGETGLSRREAGRIWADMIGVALGDGELTEKPK